MRPTQTRLAAACILAVAATAMAPKAYAAALFFERVAVRTASEATCMRFAADTARNLQFRNVYSNQVEVAGKRGSAYVSMTCIGRGQALAVVMSVSDRFDVAKQVGAEVTAKIKGITCIDGC